MSGFPLALVVEDGRFKPANAVTLSRGLLIAPILADQTWNISTRRVISHEIAR